MNRLKQSWLYLILFACAGAFGIAGCHQQPILDAASRRPPVVRRRIRGLIRLRPNLAPGEKGSAPSGTSYSTESATTATTSDADDSDYNEQPTETASESSAAVARLQSAARIPATDTSGLPATGHWALERLLLGAGRVGRATIHGCAVDAGLLGLQRRPLYLLSGPLGLAHRILRRHQLWVRLRRHRATKAATGTAATSSTTANTTT